MEKNSFDNNYHRRQLCELWYISRATRARLVGAFLNAVCISIWLTEELIKEIFFYPRYRYRNAEYIRFTLERHVAEEVHWIFYAGLYVSRRCFNATRHVLWYLPRFVPRNNCPTVSQCGPCGMHKREVTAIIDPAEMSVARKLLKARPPLKNNWPLPQEFLIY